MTMVNAEIYLAFRAAGVDEEKAKAATLAIMAYGDPKRVDLEQYRQTLLQPGERLERLAYGMLALAVVALVTIAVTLIVRG